MEEYSVASDVSVVDVYDIASEIGKECEKLIDLFGVESVTNLMPKVINALELLENLATKNERENTMVQELSAKISQLESDKIGKAEDRQRFEKVANDLTFILHCNNNLNAICNSSYLIIFDIMVTYCQICLILLGIGTNRGTLETRIP